MDFTSEYLENLPNHIEPIAKNQFYMKENLSYFSQTQKINPIKLKFSDYNIAISNNGGLIAFCVKGGHYVDKSSNKKIEVYFQNGFKKSTIMIEWDNLKKYVICLDFTPKQVLYAIINDGRIYKVNYNTSKLKQKISPNALTQAGLISAKFFEKGFIALTLGGEFFYIKDFKNMFAIRIISPFPPFINFDSNVDFIPIPAENSYTKKIELIITRQEDNGGIIVVPLNEDNTNTSVVPFGETGYFEIMGASLITRETVHKLIVSQSIEIPDKKKNKKKNKKAKNEIINEPPKIENEGKQDEIGIISAIAISPFKEKVAFYSINKQKAFLFNTDFEGGYKEVYFNCEKSPYYSEYKKEITEALEYKDGCQFLFCGEDALVLSWQRVIIISKVGIKNSLVYLSSEENIGNGKLVSKCITEVDGLRIFTNEGIFLISRVPKELYNISDVFSKDVSKKLIDIYRNTLNRKYLLNKDIRSLSPKLPRAVEDLQKVSANIFWTENNNEQNQKETQMYLLKVAQFAKKFVDKEEFNFDKFNDICKDIRIINNLRNDHDTPFFITYKEFQELDPKDLISILIKYRNFQLAADITKFIDYPMKKVLNKYVIALMKREIAKIEDSLDKQAKNEDIKEKYKTLFDNLERVPGISFIKLAKKANKYGGKKLAMYLLEQEKSSLVKIPMLMQLKHDIENPLKIAFDSYDFNAVVKVMSDIKKDDMDILYSRELNKYFRKILLYYKIYDKDKIINFLEKINNFSELYYVDIKTFQKQNTYENRIQAINECKRDLKDFEKHLKLLEKRNDFLKSDKIELFDFKAANKYMEKLEYITNFQNFCLSENKMIIHYSEKEPYKVSVYDCFKNGFKKDEANFIETQNKKIQYSQKKLNLIKFRAFCESRKPEAIEAQLQKTSLKKLGINPVNLAEIFYEYKYYDQAAYWLIQEKNISYYNYIVDLFRNMKKYKEWLEYVVSNKNISDKTNSINEVLSVSPGTERYLEELCNKYKVNINK